MKNSTAWQILYLDDHIATPNQLNALFEAGDHLPGTFAISERKESPGFLPEAEKDLGYRRWIEQVFQRDLTLLRQSLAASTWSNWDTDDLVHRGAALLDLPLPDGQILSDLVPNQIYSDIVRRVLMLLLFEDPSTIIHTFASLNDRCHQIAMYLLRNRDILDPEAQMKRTVLAGLIGLDQKDTASATSHIVKTRVIPIGTADYPIQPEQIYQDLMSRIRFENWGINYWPDFQTEIIEQRQKYMLAWLTDDYIETIFDLDLIKLLLELNPHLSISVIPRRFQYGNDASYPDVMRLLTLPEFASLCLTPRFRVCDDGPRLGTVDPRAISPKMAEWICEADCLMIKGARAYEMMQGVRKPAYFGYTVCRELSEMVTGLDSSLALPVLIRQAPGERSYCDFRASAVRRIRFQSGRTVGLAGMTACEYAGQAHCAWCDVIKASAISRATGIER